MGVEKTIIMKQFNGTDYDILYPKTTADQIENVYTENQILSSGTVTKYKLPVGSLPDAVFNKLLEAMPWTLIQEYKTAGAYTWTAPDLYNGASYKIGVYMVGGGGSGAVVNTNPQGRASGGASGRGKNIMLTVTPNQAFSLVVGAGGTSIVNKTSAGLAGGTTSFNGTTIGGGEGGLINTGGGIAPGASGGQGSDSCTGSHYTDRELYAGTSTISGGLNQSPKVSQNQFDLSMISLCAGGHQWETIAAMPDGTKGGDGAAGYADSASVIAGSATGNGNGGGGASNVAKSVGAGYTLKSGAGSDGMILIYARAI